MFRHNGTKVLVVTLIMLLLLSCVNLLTHAAPSPVYSIVSIILFGVYLLALGQVSPVSFILILPYAFFRATTLISGVAIEYGGYMEDVITQGEATGAFTRLSAVYIIFISVAALIIEAFYSRIAISQERLSALRTTLRNHVWVWIFYAIFIVSSLYVIGIGFTHGFPLLDNLDRLVYRVDAESRMYLFYMSNRFIAALLFGIIIALGDPLNRKLSLLFFLFMIVLSIFFGEKFTSIILLSIYVVTPIYLTNPSLQKRMIRHLMPALLCISLMTIPIILVMYGWENNSNAATERMINRMVGQGELWFIADKDMPDMLHNGDGAIEHNLKSFLVDDPRSLATTEPYIGVQYFMHHYMNPQMLLYYLENPYLTLTFGLEPYFLMMFGWVGMYVPLLLCCAFYAVMLVYSAWATIYARPISIFAAGKMMIWTVAGLAQGTLYMFFNYKMLILIIVAVGYEIFSSTMAKSKQRKHGHTSL